MEFNTYSHWDELLWEEVSPIYYQAFAEKGAKPKKVIYNMFKKQLCFLHIGMIEGHAAAMAITGRLHKSRALLIDYLVVHPKWRNRGLGVNFFDYIQEWALTSGDYEGLVIEVEAEESQADQQRITFWEKCGFILTDYIHQYIWVPEPYRAMYKKLKPDTELPEDGKELFMFIGQFHKSSYQG